MIELRYKVKGSTTSMDKMAYLTSLEMDAFYVELTDKGIKGNIEECLSGSKILVLNIPSGLRKHPENNFVKQMAGLLPYIEASTVKNVVFISSTSVYADDVSIPHVTETTAPYPDSESGKQLLKAERLFQNNQHFQTTILRFSGLFGADRHPARHLSGKTNVKNPDAPVNLVHQKDCIGIIADIIEKNCWNETFNASTTPHPSRQEYYTLICKQMELPLPRFDNSALSKGKHIDSKKLIDNLKYGFQIKLNN
ncbi:MAG: NAD-dependent epimerase/dehydratase family protein [Gelidibacter sp.]